MCRYGLVVIATGVLLTELLIACGATPSEPNNGVSCSKNEQGSCDCLGGEHGVQVCGEDGLFSTDCDCGDVSVIAGDGDGDDDGSGGTEGKLIDGGSGGDASLGLGGESAAGGTANPVETPAICGDGKKQGNEGCDDGELTDGDGCSKICEVEPDYECAAGTVCDSEGSNCTLTLPVTYREAAQPASCGER